MERIWLKHYPDGVAHDIDVTQFRSINELFERSVAKFYQRPAMVNMGKILSYQELDKLCQRFASFLQNHLHLKKGERIALMMPNLLQYPVCVFGALRAGLAIVNINPLYTPRELESQLKDSGAESIVILENFAHILEEVIARTAIKHVIVTAVGDLLNFPRSVLTNFVVRTIKKGVPRWSLPGKIGFKDALAYGKNQTFHVVEVSHEDIAFLQYTGGTTGLSKGAMLLHRNMLANMLQAGEWIKSVTRPGQEIIVTALPLYHIFSLTANLMVFTEIGALNVLITNPRDITSFIKELKKYPVTAVTGVNTLFNALLNHPQFNTIDFSSWRLALGGGMAVQKAVAEHFKQVTGVTLCEAYGLTETSPGVCINPLNLEQYNGSIGLPLPSTDIQIRDINGQEVAIGQSGELCVRGPQVMKGYWNQADETKKVLDKEGFLATGDIAVINPEGFVKLIDRKKDLILVSGFNVYPNEIEDVIATLAGVLEVACIGVSDSYSGEAVKVFIVRKNTTLTQEDILQHCRHNLTPYKMPKYIEFRDELPKTNVGKILRRALRDPVVSNEVL